MVKYKHKNKIAADAPQRSIASNSQPHLFSADRPITSKDEDLLDRANFARTLANAIDDWNEKDSLVVALYGLWGSGKSSVKNMVLETFRSRQRTSEIVVEFNPWQWAGQDQLAEAFFTEVEIALGKADTSKHGRHRAAKWHLYAQRLKIGSLGMDSLRHIISTVLVLLGLGWISITPISWISTLIKIVIGIILIMVGVLTWGSGIVDEIATLFSKSAEAADRNLSEIKTDIANDISTLETSIVIVIDDLDRLAPDEIRLMFQLIKANADFPNVVYLLLFQRATVEEALGDHGRDFLDKIVQVGFDLPQLQQGKVNKVLFNKLDEILSDELIRQRFDSERWVNLYTSGLQPFFYTLRDVYRFSAILTFEFGQFLGEATFEVNPIDLIGLEVLRVFEPNVYQALLSAKSILTGQEPFGPDRQYQDNAAKMVVDAIIIYAREDHKQAVSQIIKYLFPPVEWMFGGNHYSKEFSDKWYRDLRVCQFNVFDRYFFLTIPEGDISQADLERVLHSAHDVDRATAELLALKQRGLLDITLERLESYKQEIDFIHAVPFITALFNVGDDLSNYSSNIFDIDSPIYMFRIIHWYLAKEPNKEIRGQVVYKALCASSGLFMPIYFISLEEDAQDNSMLDANSFTRMRQVCLDKIKFASENGNLSSSIHMGNLLFQWQKWSSSEDPQSWVKTLVESKEGLLSLLAAFARPVRSVSLGSVAVRTIWRVNLHDLEQFISTDVLEKRVNMLDLKSFNEHDLRSTNAFNHALKRRQQGISEDTIMFDE